MQSRGSKNKNDLRPTTDKVRLAIFSMLYDEIEGANVLDLFAGTGALGLESLSRGARHVLFLDIDTATLEHNIIKMGVSSSKTRIIRGDYADLRRLFNFGKSKRKPSFDIVFIDPPYGEYPSLDILESLLKIGVLTPSTTIIYEESIRSQFEIPETFQMLKEKTYGDTMVRMICIAE